MSMQDIRIVELKNWGWPAQIPANGQDDFTAFTYFDEIAVHPVAQEEEGTPLQSAYVQMQKIFGQDCQVGSKPCIARQTIMAFTDIDAGGADCTYTPDEVQQFWDARDDVYFFMSMINVSPSARLKTEVKRIRRLLRKHRGLLYLTYEYNELLLFYKGSSLREYAKLMMQISFGKRNQGVLDTITVCSFTNARRPEDEGITVSVHLGVTNYEQAKQYLIDRGIKERSIFWLLGRNDIGFTQRKDGLQWLYDLYQDCLGQRDRFQWLSTASFSVPVPKARVKLDYQPSPLASLDSDTGGRIDSLCSLYEGKCRQLNIKPDAVFMRMLREMGVLVRNSWENRLAGDLAIYMLPELKDFLSYMEMLLQDAALSERDAETLRSCLSEFYLNILSLVSSTVHSNHKFIQIPHCAPPRFEMPSKVMAYYSLIARKIIRIFQDEDNLYGIILSPKLVDELEVKSIAIDAIGRKDQLLSVNIGEALLYDLHSTVATLGHEMAHFVGENTRCRELRRECVLAYHIYGLLSSLCKYGIDLLPEWAQANANDSVDTNRIRECALKLSRQIPAPKDNPRLLLRNLLSEVADLPRTVLYPQENRKQIFDEVFYPIFQPPACMEALLQRCGGPAGPGGRPTEGQRAYAAARAKYIFDCAVQSCRNSRFPEKTAMEFTDYVNYLFSEAYADLAMVALFHMPLKDYIHVFERGIKQMDYRENCQEDTIELIRFIAVVRAVRSVAGPAKRIPGWGVPKWDLPEGGTWSTVLRETALLNSSVKYADFCKSREIDITLLTFLVKYLRECFRCLGENFGRSEAEVEEIRHIYRNIESSRTILSQLTDIREMEKTYLFDRTAEVECVC